MKRIAISLPEIKIKYFIEGKSQDQIAKDLKVSQWVISSRMRKYGLVSLDRTRKLNPWKYKIDHHSFDNLNVHTAWWVGWMISDGFVINNRRFGLKVSLQDIDIVKKFKSFLKYTGPIYRQNVRIRNIRKTYLQAAVIPTSYRIVNKLNDYGIIPNKSLTVKFPEIIANSDESFIRAFTRGVFEGDGSLLQDWNKSIVFQIVGTRDICFKIQRYLIRFLRVTKTKLTHNTKNSNHYALRYRGKVQVLNIMGWLYYNAGKDVLNRKYAKYLSLRGKLL